jgi:hypothetical protein
MYLPFALKSTLPADEVVTEMFFAVRKAIDPPAIDIDAVDVRIIE